MDTTDKNLDSHMADQGLERISDADAEAAGAETPLPGAVADGGKPPNSGDPNYTEPKHVLEYLDQLTQIGAALDAVVEANGGGQLPGHDKIIDLINLNKELVGRIAAMYKVAEPFMTHALLLANAKMALIANGVPNAPAGGTWISNIKTCNLQQNELSFYNLVDQFGRQYAEDLLTAAYQKLAAAQAAQVEKNQAVEAGTKVQ